MLLKPLLLLIPILAQKGPESFRIAKAQGHGDGTERVLCLEWVTGPDDCGWHVGEVGTARMRGR